MTDEERLNSVDLEKGLPNDEEVIWALNYLLNLSAEDDLPLIATEKY